MNFSATICLRTPAQKNGLNTVRLQVILNRKVLPIALGFAWPELLWDAEAGRCLSKLPGKRTPAIAEQLRVIHAVLGEELTQKAADYNLIIGQALGTANEIAIRYRLSKQHLTADEFLREYNNGASRECFLTFVSNRIEERYRRSQITELTCISHHSTLNKLREFVAWTRRPTRKKPAADVDTTEATLPFCTITHRLAPDFDSYLKTVHNSSQNTCARRHRTLKAYLELARRDKISFENPYQYFASSPVAGKWRPLTEAELALLEQHYATLPPGMPHRRMLQKFLFSCHSGLRLGDLKGMAKTKVTGQRIELKPQKTYRYDEKELLLPLTRKALSFLQDSQVENELDGFFLYTDQYTNRQLQAIGKALGIETKLHHHIGRETFATNFIRRGGKVEVLQKLLGHTKLSMTMKYVHVDEAMKQAKIDRLDELDSQ